MYNFKTEENKKSFYETLDKIVESFSQQSKIRKQQAVNRTVNLFMTQRNEYKKHDQKLDGEFFDKLRGTNALCHAWFWRIVDEGFFVPTLMEMDSFRK